MEAFVAFDAPNARPQQLRDIRHMLVTDSYGNPVALFRQLSFGEISVILPNDSTFQEHLRALGIDRSVIVTKL